MACAVDWWRADPVSLIEPDYSGSDAGASGGGAASGS